MPERVPHAIEDLVGYLTACGGRDTFVLWDKAGEPDVAAARLLAEALRTRNQPGVSIEQSFNRVIVHLALETARV
jgi:hypothetical protein